METLGAAPAQTIYIGDSAVDMNTAKNAGVDSIGVTWGFRSREVLAKAGAYLLADTPYELITHVLGIDADALQKAFTRRGFGFSYFDAKEQATAYLAQAVQGKRVGFGGSMTLEELGAYDALSKAAEVHWHWKGEPPCVDCGSIRHLGQQPVRHRRSRQHRRGFQSRGGIALWRENLLYRLRREQAGAHAESCDPARAERRCAAQRHTPES